MKIDKAIFTIKLDKADESTSWLQKKRAKIQNRLDITNNSGSHRDVSRNWIILVKELIYKTCSLYIGVKPIIEQQNIWMKTNLLFQN